MADQTAPIDLLDDLYLQVGFLRNPDGSFTRLQLPPELTATTPISSYDDSPLLAKDIPINLSNNTWIRVFLPRQIIESSPPAKLPLLIFIHGGGFLFNSAASPVYENLYSTATIEIPAVLVSIEYRLAPEHKLPAAYNDGMEVLNWIKNSEDEWFSKYADISNTYIMGASAGANIAYHVGLRAASTVEFLKPLNIKALILHQIFFTGIKRTQSELRSQDDKYLPLLSCDLMWDLALPIGADRDHEYCNPLINANPEQFDQIKALGWKILVSGDEGDPLIDRQIEFLKMLEENGVDAVGKFEKGGFHGNESYDPPKCTDLCRVVREFVASPR